MTASTLSLRAANRHRPRRRKNCGPFVARTVTDLLVPSSVTLAVFVAQLAEVASEPDCSNAKLVVSTDGQETLKLLPVRTTESAGRCGREARATYAETFPPATVKSPPA